LRHGYVSLFSYVVLSRVGRGLAMNRNPIQAIPLRCLKQFMFAEVNYDLKQVRGPDPLNVQANKRPSTVNIMNTFLYMPKNAATSKGL